MLVAALVAARSAPAEASGARGPRRGAPSPWATWVTRSWNAPLAATTPARVFDYARHSITRGATTTTPDILAGRGRRRVRRDAQDNESRGVECASRGGAGRVERHHGVTASMKSSRAPTWKTTPRGDAMHLDGAAAGASTRVVGVSYQPPYPMTAFELGETRGEPVATLVMLWAAHPYRLPHLRSSTRLATGVGAFLACAQPRANPPTRWARRRRTRRTAGRGVERLRRTEPFKRRRR